MSNRTLEILSAGSEDAALQLSAELQDMRQFLEEVDYMGGSQNIKFFLAKAYLVLYMYKDLSEAQAMAILEKKQHKVHFLGATGSILLILLISGL